MAAMRSLHVVELDWLID